MSPVSGIRDGFPGQRMAVLPRPRVRAALNEPGTSTLLVTDAGYFPHAQHHGRERAAPVPQGILLVCVRGRGTVRTSSGEFAVGPDELVIIPPHSPHAYWADAADPWSLWWMHIGGTLVDDWMRLADASASTPVRRITDPFGATSLFDRALRHLEEDTTTASLLAASGAAWHVMTSLTTSRLARDSVSDSIDHAADYLREHFADAVRVTDLAGMVGLSTSHFAALFKSRIGQSVHAFHNELRMARARQLLDTTDLAVAEVSRLVGFGDSFYFARQFRQLHGQTPSSYRREHKG